MGFDLIFDDTALAFDYFDYSLDVVNSAFLFFADLSFFDTDVIEVFTLWFDSADLPGSSFLLGQASFTATQDFAGSFAISDFYVADVFGNDIDLSSTSVPAPATGALLLLACVFASLTKNRLAFGR